MPLTKPSLTYTDLKPGKLYRITEVGNVDPEFFGATVLGTNKRVQGHYGVTIDFVRRDFNKDWLGSLWGCDYDDDGDTRFEEA